MPDYLRGKTCRTGLCLLGVALFLFLPGVLLRDFWIYYEGRRALVALEMWRTHSWLAPRLMGEVFLTKPPLLYWLEMIAFSLTGGPSDWAARLPSLLAAVLGLAAFVRFIEGLLDRPSALFAGLVLALSPIYFWMAQMAEPEMVFVACGLGAMLCFGRLAARGRPSWPLELGFYGFLGLSVMAKGVFVPLITLLTVAAWMLLCRRGHRLFWLPIPGGLLLILLPLLLWLGLLRLKGYPVEALFAELGNHAGNESQEKQKSFLFYLSRLGSVMFPWPLLALPCLAAVLASFWSRPGGAWRKTGRAAWATRRDWLLRDQAQRLLLTLWFLVALIVLSTAASRKFYYALNLLPPAAGLCGLLYHDWMAVPHPRLAGFLRRHARPVLVGLFGAAVGLLLLASLKHQPRIPIPFSGERRLDGLFLMAWGSAWCLGLGLIAKIAPAKVTGNFALRAAAHWTVASLFCLATFYNFVVHPRLNGQLSIERAASEIRARLPVGAPLFSFGDNHSLCFYLASPHLPVVRGGKQLKEFARRNPGAVGLAAGKHERDLKKSGYCTILYHSDFIKEKTARVCLFRLDSPPPVPRSVAKLSPAPPRPVPRP